MKFRYAIAKMPASTYINGLTSSLHGKPDLPSTIKQHEAYCRALAQCGLEVTLLEADERYPDSTFTEDTAILGHNFAVITNPGAESRKGETEAIEAAMKKFPSVHRIHHIKPPGTVDGGDICEAEETFFIGISERTNEEGARQLAAILKDEGYRPVFVDIRGSQKLLHLKSGIAYLSHQNLVVIDELTGRPEFQNYRHVRIRPEEEYAANCVKVNDHVLFAAGYPVLQKDLAELGYDLIVLDMSEYRKQDGGLSCLSLRF